MLTGRDILLYLTNKYKANWDDIMEAIRKKEDLDSNLVETTRKETKSMFITLVDDDYPDALKKIGKPPFVLFYKGDIELLKKETSHRLSVVGSRACSEYGVKATKTIIDGLDKDFLIVSGIAKGIDKVSHEAALNNNLKTIAVLGSGLDKFYPQENIDLSKKIIESGGLILSEYPDDTEPLPINFINRNRIIAALCNFLLVTEAYEHSGTSITVNYALTLGKDVGCIPYEIEKKSICNALIKEGAYLVESAQDIIRVIR
jgi:DNA protecting protein DprA